MKFRIARLWSPRPPRHAYPAIEPKPRHAKPATLSEPLSVSLFGDMPRRPSASDTRMHRAATDFTDPAPLGHVAPLVRNQAVVMHTVALDSDTPTPAVPGPRGQWSPAADTLTLEAYSHAVDPHNWYNDLPPSQLGARVPDGDTAMRAARRSAFAELGNSALTHTTDVADRWFDTGESLSAFWFAQETRDRVRDEKIASLNRYRKVTTRSTGERQPGSLDTGILPTVATPEFINAPTGAKR